MSEELAVQSQPSGYVDVVARLLNSNEVQRWQDEIKASVFASVDEHSRNDGMIRWMLREFTQGRLQVWGIFSYDAEKPRLIGFMTTITQAYPPARKVLFIFTLHIPKGITRQGMANGIQNVVKFAKEKECSGIETLTKAPTVLALLEELGFDTSQRHCYKEI